MQQNVREADFDTLFVFKKHMPVSGFDALQRNHFSAKVVVSAMKIWLKISKKEENTKNLKNTFFK